MGGRGGSYGSRGGSYGTAPPENKPDIPLSRNDTDPWNMPQGGRGRGVPRGRGRFSGREQSNFQSIDRGKKN